MTRACLRWAVLMAALGSALMSARNTQAQICTDYYRFGPIYGNICPFVDGCMEDYGEQQTNTDFVTVADPNDLDLAGRVVVAVIESPADETPDVVQNEDASAADAGAARADTTDDVTDVAYPEYSYYEDYYGYDGYSDDQDAVEYTASHDLKHDDADYIDAQDLASTPHDEPAEVVEAETTDNIWDEAGYSNDYDDGCLYDHPCDPENNTHSEVELVPDHPSQYDEPFDAYGVSDSFVEPYEAECHQDVVADEAALAADDLEAPVADCSSDDSSVRSDDVANDDSADEAGDEPYQYHDYYRDYYRGYDAYDGCFDNPCEPAEAEETVAADSVVDQEALVDSGSACEEDCYDDCGYGQFDEYQDWNEPVADESSNADVVADAQTDVEATESCETYDYSCDYDDDCYDEYQDWEEPVTDESSDVDAAAEAQDDAEATESDESYDYDYGYDYDDDYDCYDEYQDWEEPVADESSDVDAAAEAQDDAEATESDESYDYDYGYDYDCYDEYQDWEEPVADESSDVDAAAEAQDDAEATESDESYDYDYGYDYDYDDDCYDEYQDWEEPVADESSDVDAAAEAQDDAEATESEESYDYDYGYGYEEYDEQSFDDESYEYEMYQYESYDAEEVEARQPPVDETTDDYDTYGMYEYDYYKPYDVSSVEEAQATPPAMEPTEEEADSADASEFYYDSESLRNGGPNETEATTPSDAIESASEYDAQYYGRYPYGYDDGYGYDYEYGPCEEYEAQDDAVVDLTQVAQQAWLLVDAVRFAEPVQAVQAQIEGLHQRLVQTLAHVEIQELGNLLSDSVSALARLQQPMELGDGSVYLFEFELDDTYDFAEPVLPDETPWVVEDHLSEVTGDEAIDASLVESLSWHVIVLPAGTGELITQLAQAAVARARTAWDHVAPELGRVAAATLAKASLLESETTQR